MTQLQAESRVPVILADGEECYAWSQEWEGFERSVRWIVNGLKVGDTIDVSTTGQLEAARLMATEQACSQCLEVFPRPLRLCSVDEVVLDRHIDKQARRERMMAGFCPGCGSAVDGDLFRRMFEGTEDTGADARARDDAEYEKNRRVYELMIKRGYSKDRAKREALKATH